MLPNDHVLHRRDKMKKYRYSDEELKFIEKSCIPLAIYQLGDNTVVPIAFSAGFLELFKFENKEQAYVTLNNDLYGVVHPDDVPRILEATKQHIETNEIYDLIYRVKVDNEYITVHSYVRNIHPKPDVKLSVIWYSSEGTYNLTGEVDEVILNRFYQRSLHEDCMSHEMNYDYLTGLPSMTYFLRLADEGRSRMQENGESSAILYTDLSGMKYFNKKYGFAEGDKLIKAFAITLANNFGEKNCSRFGQDHFAVFTSSNDLDNRLNKLIDECRSLNDNKTLNIRIGIYLDTMGVVETSLACDRAKYACNAKHDNYRSYYTYYDKNMLAFEVRRQYIIDNLDRAIKENWIQAYYQPIVRTANGSVCDEEALARWIDPIKGVLSPAEFIPILEDSKLIYKVDLHILDYTLKKMEIQARSGLYIVPTSINLSRVDFEVCDIVEEVRKRVDNSGIDRSKITIEITEGVFIQNMDYMKEQMSKFQNLGFKVWMDDFGSGYSSLDLLQDFNFDLIKFDMQFMRNFDKSNRNKIILTELIRMMVNLDIETICEGVETDEQVEFLKEVGCTKLQGFYYTKPISLSDILARYRNGVQIGFENPDETEYFTSLGKINLYDLAIVTSDACENFDNYFDTLPMAIIETKNDWIKVSRCNKSYREFMIKYYGDLKVSAKININSERHSSVFVRSMYNTAKNGKTLFIRETIKDGVTVNSYIRRVAVNPVTGVIACAVVVMSVN